MGSTTGERRRLLVDAALYQVVTNELDARVITAVSALENGTGAITDLEERTGLGARQLRRRFVQQVGYGPKTYQRVIRFRRFLALGHTLHCIPSGLAGLAAAAGYSDQAHLTRECRRLADRTPTQLLGDRFVQDSERDRSGSSQA
jgi:transcriptional regulator GlxA family with amidase domain